MKWLDDYLRNLEQDEARIKAELDRRLKSLKRDLEYEIERINVKNKDNYRPNSLGVVQQAGSVIDLLCSELATVQRTAETYRSMYRVYGGKKDE